MTRKLSDTIGQFATVPNSFIERSRTLSSDAKWLFVILRYHTNGKTGDAFPSYDMLQIETGLPRRKIARGLRHLVEAGWVEKKRRRNASTIYTLKIPVIPYSSNGGTFTNNADLDSSDGGTAGSVNGGTIGSSAGCTTNQTDLNQIEEQDRISADAQLAIRNSLRDERYRPMLTVADELAF